MWLQFFAQDFHFIVNLFAALVLAGVAWLYFDAWSEHHPKKELAKWSGFAILALSFLVQSTFTEQAVLGDSVLGSITETLIIALRLIGYGLVIVGMIIDPLQAVPKNEGLNLEIIVGGDNDANQTSTQRKAPAIVGAVGFGLKSALGFAGLAVAALYWRRATVGLERHLKRPAYGFALVGLADLLSMSSLLRNTDNPTLYSWVAAFGWVWLLTQVVLLVGAVLLGRWVWGYLTKRFFSQLYMVLTATTVIVFFVVTVGFTALLLNSIRSDTLVNLTTATSVLGSALDAKKAETAAAASQLANDSDVASAVVAKNRTELIARTQDYLVKKKITNLMIVTTTGQVLLRVEDPEQWGDSVSSDSLVRRAIAGADNSSLSTSQGATAPSLRVKSAKALRDKNNAVVGVVVAGLELDSAFVEGVRSATGLDSSIYSGNILAATTLVGADGKTRSSGILLNNADIQQRVLKESKPYAGSFTVQNRAMLGAFLPLKDVDNVTLGMLMVAEPESSVLYTAGKSIELTFIFTAILLLVGTIPIYFVSRSIERQLD